MKVIAYSFDFERRYVTVKVEEILTQETILFFVNNGVLDFAELDSVKKIDKNKTFFKFKCSSNENFTQLHTLLHKEMHF